MIPASMLVQGAVQCTPSSTRSHLHQRVQLGLVSLVSNAPPQRVNLPRVSLGGQPLLQRAQLRGVLRRGQ